MQLTTLNKIVSLFLIGSLVVIGIVILLCLLVLPGQLLEQVSALKSAVGEGSMTVIAGVLFLALSAAGGALSESVTAVSIRRPIKAMARSANHSRWLGQSRGTADYLFWRERFTQTVLKADAFTDVCASNHEEGVAVGILYWTRQAEAINWAEMHYSTYVLVSNLAFLSSVALLALPILAATGHCSWAAAAWGMTAATASLYAFSSMACDRLAYAYEVAFRQAVVTHLQGPSLGIGQPGLMPVTPQHPIHNAAAVPGP
jgi:uncharacterized MnhB-related membrane protein